LNLVDVEIVGVKYLQTNYLIVKSVRRCYMMETIKDLDLRCRLFNEVIHKKKIRQFTIYGHQWQRGKKDDYKVAM